MERFWRWLGFNLGAHWKIVVLLVVAVVLPPVGLLIGAFNMDKPKRRKQSQLLLGIGLVSIVVIIMFGS